MGPSHPFGCGCFAALEFTLQALCHAQHVLAKFWLAEDGVVTADKRSMSIVVNVFDPDGGSSVSKQYRSDGATLLSKMKCALDTVCALCKNTDRRPDRW